LDWLSPGTIARRDRPKACWALNPIYWTSAAQEGELGLADEFALDQRWVLALDVTEDLAKAMHLHDGISPILDRTSENISVAPAVEYNFSKSIGVIVGANSR